MTLLQHLLLLRSYYDDELDQTSKLDRQAFWEKSKEEVNAFIKEYCQ